MSSPVLADRYGTVAPWRRRALVAAAAAVVLVFLGWLAWTTLSHANPPVDSEMQTFEIVDEHTATAVLAIEFGSDDVEATCLLRAFAEDHTVVGEHSFIPDPTAGPRFEETFRTERLATSVESVGCTAEGMARPR